MKSMIHSLGKSPPTFQSRILMSSWVTLFTWLYVLLLSWFVVAPPMKWEWPALYLLDFLWLVRRVLTDARRAVDMLSDKRDFLFFLCVRVCDCDCCSLVGGLRVCWISIQCPSSNHKESVASLHLVWAPRSATTVTCGPAVGFTASIDSVNSNLWSYSFYPFLKCPRMARKDVSLADCVGVVVVFFSSML